MPFNAKSFLGCPSMTQHQKLKKNSLFGAIHFDVN
jgi:hypothetical protein